MHMSLKSLYVQASFFILSKICTFLIKIIPDISLPVDYNDYGSQLEATVAWGVKGSHRSLIL